MKFASSLPQVLERDATTGKLRKKIARTKHIGFFGLFGVGNFGNDGSLEAMLQLVKEARPSAKLLCICGLPTNVGPKLGVQSIRINWRPNSKIFLRLDRFLLHIPREIVSLFNAIRHIRKLDVLIIPGTGILDDFSTGPTGMPYWIIRWCSLARIFGTKVLFVSIGAGPIYHPLSRLLMKTAARMADYRSYRDRISRDFMSNIGLDVRNDVVCPDVAFALPQPRSLREPSTEGKPIIVGLGVMSYNGWRADRARHASIYNTYLQKLESFARWLLSEGYGVRILMGDADDQRTVERLYQAINTHAGLTQSAVRAEPANSLHDVMSQIAETDVVVATRYHNVVCALKLGRPTISLGYAEKNDLLLQAMGLGDFCLHIEHFNLDSLIDKFRNLVVGHKGYEDKIREANSIFSESLNVQNDLLLSRYL